MAPSTTTTSTATWQLVASIAAELNEDVHTLQTGYLNRHTGRTPVLGVDRGGHKRVWLWIGDLPHARELNAVALSEHLGARKGRLERILECAQALHAYNPHGAWPARKDETTSLVLGPTGIERASGALWPMGLRTVFETLQRTMPGCEVIHFSSATIHKGRSTSQTRSYAHVTDTVGKGRLAILLPNFNGIVRGFIAASSKKLESEDRLTAEAWAHSLGVSEADLVDAGIAMQTIAAFTDINQIRLR